MALQHIAAPIFSHHEGLIYGTLQWQRYGKNQTESNVMNI
jgi:hypothetical protein